MSVSPENVEGILQIFKSVIMDSIKTYVPLRHVVNNFSSRQYPKYIQHASKKKCVLWCRRLYLGGSRLYKWHARKYKGMVHRFHVNSERNLLNNNSTSAFYRHVNSKHNASHGSAPLRNGTNLLMNDADKAYTFNNLLVLSFRLLILHLLLINQHLHIPQMMLISLLLLLLHLYVKLRILFLRDLISSLQYSGPNSHLYLLFLYQFFLRHLINFLFYPLTGSTHLLCRYIKREIQT